MTAYVCTTCGAAQPSLLKAFSIGLQLRKCGSCGNVADPYLQSERFIALVDMALHQRPAFRHALVNRRPRGGALSIPSLLAMLVLAELYQTLYLDAAASRGDTAYREAVPSVVHAPTPAAAAADDLCHPTARIDLLAQHAWMASYVAITAAAGVPAVAPGGGGGSSNGGGSDGDAGQSQSRRMTVQCSGGSCAAAAGAAAAAAAAETVVDSYALPAAPTAVTGGELRSSAFSMWPFSRDSRVIYESHKLPSGGGGDSSTTGGGGDVAESIFGARRLLSAAARAAARGAVWWAAYLATILLLLRQAPWLLGARVGGAGVIHPTLVAHSLLLSAAPKLVGAALTVCWVFDPRFFALLDALVLSSNTVALSAVTGAGRARCALIVLAAAATASLLGAGLVRG